MCRILFVTLFAFFSHIASAQLVNGGSVTGTISAAGQIDSYFFDGVAGESVRIRVGDTGATSLFPRVELFDASNTSVAFNNGTDAAWISVTLTSTETYKIEVSDQNASATGAYVLHFAYMPGANEFGTLHKDILVSESITLADIDSYTFSAVDGADIEITVVDLDATALFPRIHLFDPDGAWIGAADGPTTATLSQVLTTDGLYTVTVYDGTSGGWRTGDYSIELTGTGIQEIEVYNAPLPAWALAAMSILFVVIVGLLSTRRASR